MTDPEPVAPPPAGELPWALEALLFVADEPLSAGALAAATGVGCLSVASFTVQLIVCRWWSDQIGAGPIERVLRWMTDGHRP